MYLSAERISLANQAIRETFEQTCVAWQTIPHWDTGDPGQTQVPNGSPTGPSFQQLNPMPLPPFEVTLAEAISPTPDALIAKVMANTVKLAALVDTSVFKDVHLSAAYYGSTVHVTAPTPNDILDALIDARVEVEKAGYRAPSCLLTDTVGVKELNKLFNGYSVLDSLLGPANINSLQRIDPLPPADARGLLLGRRQRIAHGGGSGASPGEEPVDLAVSISPSLEVVGDTATNTIELRIRMTFATRVKEADGVVVFVAP
jgi:hypothetical protein